MILDDMTGMNLVVLLGTLAGDPQMAYLPNQVASTTIDLIVGEDRFDCCAFGRRAEVMTQFLTKGSEILIDGHLQTNQREDQSGRSHEILRIIINHIQFLDRP